ncbi:unnamed protein product [Bursaphelenchus okinawaensis]|uniref:Uncharacterized protein n=1 Tax=Bursaphelenchus okinawaensis TaxID=465554 RepID=A0A811K1B5_9BILA|nr:unnamed protein product [Bursaphelenchus okinawaensis]CAG9089632.1 unnamed protein product [Bursaphelenchus okinawaensis]
MFFGVTSLFAWWIGLGVSALIGGLILVACAACLMYAVQTGRNKFYWPFLVCNLLYIIIKVVLLVISWLSYYNNPATKDGLSAEESAEGKDPLHDMKIILPIVTALYSIEILLQIWFEYVVGKSYRRLGIP